jgi:hypothetical protein
VALTKILPGIRLEQLRKTTKNLSQDRRSAGRDLNPGAPEYEARLLATRPRRSVFRTEGTFEIFWLPRTRSYCHTRRRKRFLYVYD